MARNTPRHPSGFRRCVSCRQLFEKTTLHRVVYPKQSNSVELVKAGELQQKPEGRSAYCCPQEACINIAIRGKRLAKALKRPLSGDIVHVLGL